MDGRCDKQMLHEIAQAHRIALIICQQKNKFSYWLNKMPRNTQKMVFHIQRRIATSKMTKNVGPVLGYKLQSTEKKNYRTIGEKT